MVRSMVRFLLVAFAVAAFLGLAPMAKAQDGDFSPADKATIRGYVLTAPKLNAYIAATAMLAAAKKSDPTLGAELKATENEPNGSLAEMRAGIARHPKLFGFYQRQGLSADDTILVPLVLSLAEAAAEANNPPELADLISPAQVQFARANPALGQKLGEALEALEGKGGAAP